MRDVNICMPLVENLGILTSDVDVSNNGALIARIKAREWYAEYWTLKVRKLSGQRVDWGFHHDVIQVKYIGDHSLVLAAIRDLPPQPGVEILRIFGPRGEECLLGRP